MVANKHLKRCSTSLVPVGYFRKFYYEIQIKSKRDTTTNLKKWLKLKRLSVPNVDDNVEQLELSYTTIGSVKWYTLGKVLAVFYET